MPLAVITLDFDPILRLGGWSVPWETVGIGGAILVALIVAALIAGRMPAKERNAAVADGAGEADDPAVGVRDDGRDDVDGNLDLALDVEENGREPHLRRDDILLIALGILPGAVVGGRLVYGLVHLDYFRVHADALVDPSVGSLSLSGAVVGGILTGAVVAHLLGPSLERWMRAAAVPMLLALALGKGALVLGGAGQGTPNDGPISIRFAGPGPWADPLATVPAQPSQLIEAAGVLLVLVAVGLLAATRAGRSGTTLFAVAVGLWALVRTAVAASWRDPVIVGSLRAEQLVCLAIAVVSLATAAAIRPVLRRRRERRQPRAFDTA